MSDKSAQPNFGHAPTLLAGIRADEAAFIAFPSACSGHSVAEMKAECSCNQSLAGTFVRFTVAGAAQVKNLGAFESGLTRPRRR